MRCKHCNDKFVVKYFNQKFCMLKDECIKAFVESCKKSLIDKKVKQFKENIKTHADWLNELQVVFNEYIRLRDYDKPCISCDTIKQDIQYHAGHCFSVGAYPNLRFDEDNVHKQCGNNCNKNKHGNQAEYLLRLPKRIGQKRFDELLARRGLELKITIPEIKEKIAYYKAQIKILKQSFD